MKESLVKGNINRHLDPTIYKQSLTGAAISGNGIPDHYYDGRSADLWIEYKALNRLPRAPTISVAPRPNVKQQPKGHLTPLQFRWLTRRWTAGENAFVILGIVPNQVVIILGNELSLPIEWDTRRITYREAATWIQEFCGV